MKTLITCSIISLIILVGCSGGLQLTTSEKNPNCQTTIEGFYRNDEFWTEKYPALVTKQDWELTIVYGEILKLEDNGIRFDPRPEGLFYDPPEKLYKYDEIVCAIDKERKVVYGNLPDKYKDIWSLELQFFSAGKSNEKPIEITLKPNNKFSYCIEPDQYIIRKFIFKSHKGMIDEAVEFPEISFRASPGVANYIGDIYLDYASPDQPNVCVIPYRPKYRPRGAMAAALFGAVGSAVYSASLQKRGLHTLTVEMNKEFLSNTGLTLKESPIQFSAEHIETKSPDKN